MLNPTGTTTLISLPDTSGGGAGKSSARCTSASGSSSSAAKPELVAIRLDMTVAIDAESELGHALLAPGARLLRSTCYVRASRRSGCAKSVPPWARAVSGPTRIAASRP
jgi:hypothetical protein